MGKPVRDQKLLYHLTSINNIKSIFEKGLLARSCLSDDFDDVADPDIIAKRKKMGILDKIPFHFFFSNPFDGRIQKDNTAKHFIYIAIWRSFARENGFQIIPRHPLICADDEIYSYDMGFAKIEWDVLEGRDYQDHYCRNVCMAECLGPSYLGTENFAYIYTKDAKDKKTVTDVASKVLKIYSFNIEERPQYFVING